MQEVHFTKYDQDVSALIIHDKMDVLLVLKNEFLRETKRDGMASFMDFVMILFCRENTANSSQFECFEGKMTY